MIEMKKVKLSDVYELRQISIETFKDTFGDDNSKQDLEEMFENNYGIDQLKKEISDDKTDFEFIYVDNELAGYLKINIGEAQSEDMGSDYLEIERIYIRKNFKRRGLGSQFMSYAINAAKEADKNYIWLGVWENNTNAISFYQVKGFMPFSEHIFVVGSDKQRDILMKKPI